MTLFCKTLYIFNNMTLSHVKINCGITVMIFRYTTDGGTRETLEKGNVPLYNVYSGNVNHSDDSLSSS